MSPDHTKRPITCLSDEFHINENITDKLVHYLGCIPLCDRKAYYDDLQPESQQQVRLELRRIAFIRQVIENSRADKPVAANLTHSLERWRKSAEKKIDEVKQWRYKVKAKPNAETPYHDPNSARQAKEGFPESYNVEKDYNAYMMQFDSSVGVTNTTCRENGNFLFKGKFPNQKISVDALLHDPVFNPLKRQTKEPGREEVNRIRYFHLPSNNMKWVQDLIARYYDEDEPQYDNRFRKVPVDKRTCANSLLSRDYWLGQEQGRSSPIHRRHLRPLCEPVSSDPLRSESRPRNIVLFMPYLHWELDQQRAHFSSFIDKRSALHQDKLLQDEYDSYERRREERKDLYPRHVREQTIERNNGTRVTTGSADHQPPNDPPETVNRRVRREPSGRFRHIITQWPRKDKTGRLLTSHSLGQLLWDASRLFAAINNYRDQKLIEKYLLEDPPLHPRRTLDQSYYWTLRNTKSRDRDQVVYRGTSAKSAELHQHLPDEKPKEWERGQGTQTNNWQGWTSMSDTAWDAVIGSLVRDDELPTIEPRRCNHDTHGPPHVECLTCREAIRRTPRLIMVDQLWMWILDEDTIVTAFPKRYSTRGADHQDTSGIHKAIRQRLGRARHNHVRSAFDLAIIIIDECSSLFFDRTKTDQRQPQVMDIFSEAIGNVAQKQTISSKHLWNWADKLAKASTKKSSLIDLSSLHLALLNITPEGKLQRETKDIIEELDIMLNISKKQKELLKRFKKHAENLLDPKGMFKAGQKLDSMGRVATNLGQLEGPDSEQFEKFKWFRANAEEILQEADDHIDELEGLRKSADDVCRNLDSLLSLKQQQASVVQAWQSITISEETSRQGRALMMFTFVTIIFLPLAFLTSVLSLFNDNEFARKMRFSEQMMLIFTISIGVVVFVVFIAFSDFIRASTYSVYHYSFNWLLIHTGLYGIWLDLADKMHSDNMVLYAEKQVNEMKDKVKMERRRHLAKKYEQERNRSFQSDTQPPNQNGIPLRQMG